MNVESDFWVRVLLLDDVEEIYVKTMANLSIETGNSQFSTSVIENSLHKGQPFKVAQVNGNILIFGQSPVIVKRILIEAS